MLNINLMLPNKRKCQKILYGESSGFWGSFPTARHPFYWFDELKRENARFEESSVVQYHRNRCANPVIIIRAISSPFYRKFRGAGSRQEAEQVKSS
jgi:hypothetical protein